MDERIHDRSRAADAVCRSLLVGLHHVPVDWVLPHVFGVFVFPDRTYRVRARDRVAVFEGRYFQLLTQTRCNTAAH